jgi:hypothetical protein
MAKKRIRPPRLNSRRKRRARQCRPFTEAENAEACEAFWLAGEAVRAAVTAEEVAESSAAYREAALVER